MDFVVGDQLLTSRVRFLVRARYGHEHLACGNRQVAANCCKSQVIHVNICWCHMSDTRLPARELSSVLAASDRFEYKFTMAPQNNGYEIQRVCNK